MKDVPIVTTATAYTCPNTGQTYILVFNEFLWYSTQMEHSLINPNQVRAYGIPLWDNPFDPIRPTHIEIDETIVIPLQGQGTKLHFQGRLVPLIKTHSSNRVTIWQWQSTTEKRSKRSKSHCRSRRLAQTGRHIRALLLRKTIRYHLVQSDSHSLPESSILETALPQQIKSCSSIRRVCWNRSRETQHL